MGVRDEGLDPPRGKVDRMSPAKHRYFPPPRKRTESHVTVPSARSDGPDLVAATTSAQRLGASTETVRDRTDPPLLSMFHRNGNARTQGSEQLTLDDVLGAARKRSLRSARSEPQSEQFEIDTDANLVLRRVRR